MGCEMAVAVGVGAEEGREALERIEDRLLGFVGACMWYQYCFR